MNAGEHILLMFNGIKLLRKPTTQDGVFVFFSSGEHFNIERAYFEIVAGDGGLNIVWPYGL